MTRALEKFKEQNRSYREKAERFIDKVKEAYRQFKARLSKIFARVRSAIKDILDDPVQFLKNMLKAVYQGFNQFKSNIAKHLKTGIFDWMFGSFSRAGVSFQIPKDFSGKSVFSFIMQVLGFTKEWILARAAKVIGRRNVALLEKVHGYVKPLLIKGPAGMYAELQEKAGNLKDTIIDEVRSWAITQIIKAAIIKLVTMFNPAGAIAQAILTIVDVVIFFANNIDLILKVLETIVDSVYKVVKGNIQAAANMIEKALAMGLSLAIRFLARFAKLSGIVGKIRSIMKRFKRRITRAVDKALKKIVKRFKGVAGKGKAAVAKLISWWKVKKKFTNKAGESHTLYFAGSGKAAKLTIRSTPKTFTEYINSIKPQTPEETKAHSQAKTLAAKIDAMKKTKTTTDKKGNFRKKDVTKGFERKLEELSGVLAVFQSRGQEGQIPPTSRIRFAGLTAQQFGRGVIVDKLTKIGPPGGQPQVTSRWWRTLTLRKDGKGSYYVRGHLLNHNLHGTGTNWKNLTPLTQGANNRNNDSMLHTFEKYVKRSVDAGNAVYFEVMPIYEAPTPGVISRINVNPEGLPPKYNANDLKKIKQIAQIEAKIPSSIKCEAQEYDPFKDKKSKAPKPSLKGKISKTVSNRIESSNITDYDLVPTKAPDPGRVDNAEAMKTAGVDNKHADQIVEAVRKINEDGKRVNTAAQLEKALPALASAIQGYYKNKLISFQRGNPKNQ